MRVLCFALVALALAEEVELEQARLQKISLGPNTASRHAGEAKLAIDAELDLAEELTAVATGESAVLTIDAEPDSPARIVFADDKAPMQIIKNYGEAALRIEGGSLFSNGFDVTDCRKTVAEQRTTIMEQKAAIKQALETIESHVVTIGDQKVTIKTHKDTIEAHEKQMEKDQKTIAYLKTFTRKCFCQNGIALEGPSCDPDRGHKCASCHKGYHMVDKDAECVVNMCACFHGRPHTGPQCPQHGTPSCRTCDIGYKLVGKFCQYA